MCLSWGLAAQDHRDLNVFPGVSLNICASLFNCIFLEDTKKDQVVFLFILCVVRRI